MPTTDPPTDDPTNDEAPMTTAAEDPWYEPVADWVHVQEKGGTRHITVPDVLTMLMVAKAEWTPTMGLRVQHLLTALGLHCIVLRRPGRQRIYAFTRDVLTPKET